jgi:hypothetical protein
MGLVAGFPVRCAAWETPAFGFNLFAFGFSLFPFDIAIPLGDKQSGEAIAREAPNLYPSPGGWIECPRKFRGPE